MSNHGRNLMSRLNNGEKMSPALKRHLLLAKKYVKLDTELAALAEKMEENGVNLTEEEYDFINLVYAGAIGVNDAKLDPFEGAWCRSTG